MVAFPVYLRVYGAVLGASATGLPAERFTSVCTERLAAAATRTRTLSVYLRVYGAVPHVRDSPIDGFRFTSVCTERLDPR